MGYALRDDKELPAQSACGAVRDRERPQATAEACEASDALGVPRKHVSAIVNGRAPITPDMAVRLAGVFGTEPEIWVNLQAQYDLWLVRQQAKPKVKPLHPIA